jgi:hypothetical protein
LLGNYGDDARSGATDGDEATAGTLSLRPYEARVYEV